MIGSVRTRFQPVALPASARAVAPSIGTTPSRGEPLRQAGDLPDSYRYHGIDVDSIARVALEVAA